jgi:hypothetical protein
VKPQQPAAGSSASVKPFSDPTRLASDVAALVARQPVVLFMKGTPDAPQCGFSARVVKMLRQHGEPRYLFCMEQC